MKLLKLEILNLASLDRQEGEIIDFEKGALKDSNIFSIVGPTGSGKSTILDAICLALYNRAPRYPRKNKEKNQNIEIYGKKETEEKNRLAPTDSRNILTRGKKEGYSKLTFLANNGHVYRAEWYVKFQRVKYENAVTSLYRLTMKDGLPAEEAARWEDLPSIIGLDYEQFLRTVLIAQGSFANFLTSKENERYELLEKLIGCEEQYTLITRKIKEQKDESVKAYELINANFAAYEKDLIPAEELEALEARIKGLEEQEKKVKEELVKINEALTWYQAEALHQQHIQTFAEAQTIAEKNLEDAKADIDRLRLHDSTLPATLLYKDLIEAEAKRQQIGITLKELEGKIDRQTTDIQAGEEALQTLKEAEEKAAEIYEQQKPHINKARTLKGELAIERDSVKEKEKAKEEAEKAHQKASDEVKKNAENVTNYEKKRGEILQANEELKAAIDEEKQKIAQKVEVATQAFQKENAKIEGLDATKLNEEKSQADQKLNDLKEAIRIRKDIEKKEATLKANQASLEALNVRNQAIDSELKTLRIDELTTELETLRKTYTLMTSENWSSHRHLLEDGKACPLCGATAHPYQQEEALVPVIDNLQKMIQKKAKDFEEQIKHQRELHQEQATHHGTIKTTERSNRLLQEELQTLQGEWENIHEKHTEWQADVKTLETFQTEATQKANDASKALRSYNETVTEINRLRKIKEENEQKQTRYANESEEKLRKAEQLKSEIEILLTTEKGKTDNLVAQAKEKKDMLDEAIAAWEKAKSGVASKLDSLKAEIGEKDPDAFEQELTSNIKKATEAVQKKNEALGKLRETLKGLKGERDTTQKNEAEEHQKHQQSSEALTRWLEDFNAHNEAPALTQEDIDRLYRATDDWEAIRKQETELNTALTQARTTLANEQEAHQKHQEKKPDATQEELTTRKTELENQSNAELTDAKARRQRHEQAKVQTGTLYEERQEAEGLKREWEEIADAIGGDGKTLRKIAQCYTLRFLIEHANAEIRKFNSRYELQQVKHSLGIRVIDHDRADDVRDTTSLSGGETFIVSLGLALGLSALSSRNISFENLFIDEGFGTLDPDTLAVVIDSLAMLQSSQGKKVGVISHTDTMSERITTQIRIIKNGNSGSSHIEIYP